MSKAKGSRWERECKRMLEAEGYWVTKAGGSLGAFDLVAIGNLNIRLIQCKCNTWATPKERAAMATVPQPADSVFIEIWRKDDYKPAPRIMQYDNIFSYEWRINEPIGDYWQSVRERLKKGGA